MIKNTTIVPCAGDFQISNSGFVNYSSNAMLPLNGKPVISWIIDNLRDKRINDIIIVSRLDDVLLNNFLNWAYCDVKVVHVNSNESSSILDSLLAGLSSFSISKYHVISILLGDTLIYDSFEEPIDFLYAGFKNDSRKWCYVNIDSNYNLTGLTDEVRNENLDSLVASGYYKFTNGELLLNNLIECIRLNKLELSDVIKSYAKVNPFVVKVCNSWFDFGHIEGILNSKRKLISARSFNSLIIDPVLNTITKTSKNNEKLRDELNWYNLIPEELKVLSPRLLKTSTNDDIVTIVQEFYGYPTLSELYLYGKITKSIWGEILRHLFVLNHEFRKYSKAISNGLYYKIYIDKTRDRIQELYNQKEFYDLLKFDIILINGIEYRNLPVLLDDFLLKLEFLCETDNHTHIIHGDFCFSNILFDVNSFIIKLIDPRGSFGEKGVYGDPRYEIAKLRHSAIGKYDFIVSNLFKVNLIDNKIEFSIATNENYTIVQNLFDSFVIHNNYNLEEIKLIEASLFISMLPLHSDNFNRQLMLYITGILKLNELL
jgi:dTDP-glucose pyrophosphorylase